MFPRLLGFWQKVQPKQHDATFAMNMMKKEVFSAFKFKRKQSHCHAYVILLSRSLSHFDCRRLASSSSSGNHDLTGFKHFFRSDQHSRNTTSSKCVSFRNSTSLSVSYMYLTLGYQKQVGLLHNLHVGLANCHLKRCMASKASKAGKGNRKKHRVPEDTDSDESDDDIVKTDEEDLEIDWDAEIDEKRSSDKLTESLPEWKEIQQHVPSLRLDAVLSAGLGVSRKKIEDAYLGTRLRLNGEKVVKKSKQVKEGDILDMILERSTPSKAKEGDVNVDGLTVMRLHVMEVSTDRTSKDRVPVLLRRWKNLRLLQEKK